MAVLTLMLTFLQSWNINWNIQADNSQEWSLFHQIFNPLSEGMQTQAWLILAFILMALCIALIMRYRYGGADGRLYYLHISLMVFGHMLMLRLEIHHQLLTRHLQWAILGLAFLLLILIFLKSCHLEWIRQHKYLLVLAGASLLLLTALFGKEINHHRLWMSFGPISFQPIELIKVIFVFAIAGYLSEWIDTQDVQWRQLSCLQHISRIIPTVIVFTCLALPAFIQRDIGPIFLMSMLYFLMLSIGAGQIILPFSHIITLMGVGYTSYFMGWPQIIRIRVNMWLDPFAYSEQITQNMWALSNSGFWGVGYGLGRPDLIPVVYSDMILALVVEEWGWLGFISILLLTITFLCRSLKLLHVLSDSFSRLLVLGMVSLIFIQILTITLGTLVLIPLTGITMPWLSYGGTSMIVINMIVGALLKLSNMEK